MTRPDQDKYPISQLFGENPQIYSRFGMLGHNGWDLGCPTNTTLVAPHSGKITEIGDDPDGYGIYLKIESDTEGSVLAHNKQIIVERGQYVDEGQAVCISNSTGFSTGPHSHWGYFKIPRDRTNGYLGYIDPTPYFTNSDTIEPVMNDQTIIPKELLEEEADKEIQQIRGLLKDGKRDNLDLQSTRKENEELKIALKEYREKPIEPVFTVDLSQVSIQDLLIALIKKIFK